MVVKTRCTTERVSMAVLGAFIATTWFLAMLPGVGQALMLRQTLVHGRLAALLTIAGTATGLLVWSIAAAGGLSALLLANETAYTVVRWLGGLFLAYVGLRGILTAHREVPASGADTVCDAGADAVSDTVRPRHAFIAGLMTNLGNPKAGVFAISLLPQFAPAHGNVFLATAGLGLLWALVTAAWYVVFVSLVQRCRTGVTGPRAQRTVNRGTGTILFALGVGVVLGI